MCLPCIYRVSNVYLLCVYGVNKKKGIMQYRETLGQPLSIFSQDLLPEIERLQALPPAERCFPVIFFLMEYRHLFCLWNSEEYRHLIPEIRTAAGSSPVRS